MDVQCSFFFFLKKKRLDSENCLLIVFSGPHVRFAILQQSRPNRIPRGVSRIFRRPRRVIQCSVSDGLMHANKRIEKKKKKSQPNILSYWSSGIRTAARRSDYPTKRVCIRRETCSESIPRAAAVYETILYGHGLILCRKHLPRTEEIAACQTKDRNCLRSLRLFLHLYRFLETYTYRLQVHFYLDHPVRSRG